MRRTIQTPLLYFSEAHNVPAADRFGVRLITQFIYIPKYQFFVPYLAVVNEKKSRTPYHIPDGYFTLPDNPYLRYTLKLRPFRRELPELISRQYFFAEALEVEGVHDRRAIESGEVIRGLLKKISG